MPVAAQREVKITTLIQRPAKKTAGECSDLSRLSGMTPGDSVAGTVSVSVTGVVAVVVSSREELMKEVVLEAEGLVVMGVCASCSPS